MLPLTDSASISSPFSHDHTLCLSFFPHLCLDSCLSCPFTACFWKFEATVMESDQTRRQGERTQQQGYCHNPTGRENQQLLLLNSLYSRQQEEQMFVQSFSLPQSRNGSFWKKKDSDEYKELNLHYAYRSLVVHAMQLS